jgi:hypothetical protein
MGTNEFEVRRVLCDTRTVNQAIDEVEGKWLQALLLRCNVPSLMLQKKLGNELGNAQWRDYLFDYFRLNVYKDLPSKGVKVYQWQDEKEENVLIGEWHKPRVTKIKQGSKSHCELRLKYWHLI